MTTRFNMVPREGDVLGLATHGYHKIHYLEWGDPQSEKVVLCLHGFSRNGRDFDYLAQDLALKGYRVICPDMPGRGKSDWLVNPLDYNYTKHGSEILTLLARLNVDKVDIIGTSMGGILGMALASFPNPPLGRVVMNDVGPFIPSGPQQRIREYLGLYPTFKMKEKAKSYLTQLLTPFGPYTSEQIDHAMEHSYFLNKEKLYQLAYDQNILVNFTGEEADLWAMWERVELPILLIRGEKSELLTLNCVDRMMEKKNVSFVEFPNIGHAPALNSPNQIHTIVEWLEAGH